MSAMPVLARFLARRVASAAAVLLLVTIAVFLLVHLAPGGPEQAVGGKFATVEQQREIRASLGLDDPLPVQYGRFLERAARLDFGTSFTTRQDVTEAIGEALQVSGPLVLVSFALITVIGTAAGTLAALRAGGPLDRLVVGGGLLGAASPTFVTALVLLTVFGVKLRWLPVFGDGDDPADRALHLVLPIATLTIAGTAAMLQITRTRVLEVLREDHITFARARGLPHRRIIGRFVLRNAGIQVVTRSGTILVGLVSWGLLVEMTFGLNGVGALLVKAINERDVPTVQGVTMLIAASIVAVNVAVDLLYFTLDPRVRLTGRTSGA
ncbi:ABC transporter permease [Actinomadura geliboluensis]|uniref:ABC transporter permease n=2 Tax=Thermomonosporaceae TaxID=2012 RepID=A0A5S4GNL6_9ACTN|nr:ABC transporter permease [Actinomadura geliboluensis]